MGELTVRQVSLKSLPGHRAIVIPIAAPDVQVVICDRIGEVMAVAYISTNDVVWKFNNPNDDIRQKVENELIRLFGGFEND